MTYSLFGIGVNEKVTIGRALLLSTKTLDAPHYRIAAHKISAEVERFQKTMKTVQQHFAQIQADIDQNAPPEMAAIIGVHAMFAQDNMIINNSISLIENEFYNAEWALSETIQNLVDQFEEFEDAYLRERKHDVRQVGAHIMQTLRGNTLGHSIKDQLLDDDLILVAHDIAPADMMQFKGKSFAGFVTDLGGVTSHTAIVARGLGVPAVVATGNGRQIIQQGDWLIIDGANGVVLGNPDEWVLSQYKKRQEIQQIASDKLRSLIGLKSTSLDEETILLMANIELPKDIDEVINLKADGVGLFRSEFLFLDRKNLPTEEEQFKTYHEVVSKLAPLPVTIRTLDVGADKALAYDDSVVPTNPSLGLRAIRFSLSHPELFLIQLSAILRASAFGKVKILLPMISGLEELQQALEYIDLAKQHLKRKNQSFDPDIAIGIMVEVPSSAIMLHAMLPFIDFISIGTNDLTQYLLAVDRADADVAYLYDETHPAVLNTLAHIIAVCIQQNKDVSICGEMAGNHKLTRFFLGLGLNSLSMNASQLLPVKYKIRNSRVSTCKTRIKQILDAGTIDTVNMQLNQLNQDNHSR